MRSAFTRAKIYRRALIKRQDPPPDSLWEKILWVILKLIF